MNDLFKLQRTIKGVTLPYPVMIGGGVFKTTDQLRRYVPTEVIPEWGSITTEPKTGNGGRDYYAHYENGTLRFTLNSIGLTNPGMDYVEMHAREMIGLYANYSKPLALNVSGEGLEDSLVLLKRAVACGFPIITVNTACPNRASKGTRPMPMMCYDIEIMSEFIIRADAEIGRTNSVIMLKISTGLPFPTLRQICAVLKGSRVTFSGIITGNTMPNGFHYLEDGAPAIKTENGLEVGGMSGPAIKPIALSQTKFAADFFGGTKVVWGCGGIMNVSDIRDYFRAGASVVQLVTSFREANEDEHFVMSLLEELMCY